MGDEATDDDERPSRRFLGGAFRSGTGSAAVFWGVLVVIFGIVGYRSSGTVGDAFWGVSALCAVLGAINLGYYLTGRGRGHWTLHDSDGGSHSG